MDVAIRTSSIITSVLCCICDAQLRLFRNKDEPIDTPPRTVDDVIRMSKELRANRSTAPAASLAPYYTSKEVIRTFILVTDEEENTPVNIDGKCYHFADLYKNIVKKYIQQN